MLVVAREQGSCRRYSIACRDRMGPRGSFGRQANPDRDCSVKLEVLRPVVALDDRHRAFGDRVADLRGLVVVGVLVARNGISVRRKFDDRPARVEPVGAFNILVFGRA